MPRTYKYYGTYTFLNGNKLDKIKQLGYKDNYHDQFRIVCKAKSMAEANRIAESFGFYKDTFRREYTSETGNKIELEMTDKYGFIVCLGGTIGDKYIDIRQLL